MSLLGKLFGNGPRLTPTHVHTEADFVREVLESAVPVILDVWSPTCAPCKKLEPVLVRVATKYQGRIKVAETSTDAEPRLLARLGVRATPTLVVFDQGHEVGRMAGFRPEGWFDQMID
ncbi:MAG: thioredoxin family protein, partial [Myxococcales bacterium]|nr:thioredoxin family protein [Myxococcales bacterium]